MSYIGRIQKAITDRAPYWIATGYGGVFLQALGLTLDTAQATLLHALKQTRPTTALEDALTYLGADRGIRRYPTEPLASYRERLRRWRQIHSHAGSHYGQMLNLQPFFLPGAVPRIRIVHQMGDGSCATWHTMSSAGVYSVHKATPSNWPWDFATFQWSRHWAIIDVSDIGDVAAQYGDGTTYGDGTVWGGHLSAAQIADIVSILNDSKGAHTVLWGVILATDAASFDPASTAVADAYGATSLPVGGNWQWAADPITGLPTRLSTARFPYDLSGT